MITTRRRSVVASVVVVAMLGTLMAVVWTGPASAASLVNPPTRLYMAPTGTTLAAELVGVPIGEMPFTGQDIISSDDRELVVQVEVGDAGCAPDESNNWAIDDCPRVQMEVSHGTIEVGSATTELRDDVNGDPDPADPVYVLAGGAIIDQITNPPDLPSTIIHLNGTKTMLDAALADLVYTPDPGYYYHGSNPETLDLMVITGQDGDDPVPPPLEEPSSQSYDIEIRVLDVNDFPILDGPAGPVQAAPEIEEVITGFAASDEDNDEDVDGAQADPPVPFPDPIDGAGTNMLLVGFLECGQPLTPLVEGFHFQGGTFQADDTSIEDILDDVYGTGLFPEYEPVVDAILAGLDAIEPGLSTMPLATSNPSDYTTAFAGVATMDAVQYALAEITFMNESPSDSCELITVVSDLGNNGLPLQYLGDPPEGVEVPFLGFDFHTLTINTGDLEEVDASFAGPVVAPEGTTAEATINITPAIHPAFDLILAANDGPVVGGAIGGSDFAATSNATVSVAENATSVTFGTNAFNDSDVEGPETFTFSLEPPVDPPPGWTVVSATPVATVTIIDDDDAARSITSVSNPSVVEGDAGTTALTFMLTLDGPADGNETVEVDTADGSATTADNDYEPLVDEVVSFAPGATTASVDVTVNGDTDIEPDQQFSLLLSSPTFVSIGDTSGAGTITTDDIAPDPAPTVTIDQAVGQLDPALVGPILFTVVFSEPVSGFTDADVSFVGSTAPGALVASVSGGGPSYTVSVSGMTGAGDVVASVVAGAALDSAVQPSGASTSTDNVVTYDPVDPDPAPTVTIDQAVGQLDPALVGPILFTVVFSEPVSGFTDADVSFVGSTAPGALVASVSGGGPSYTVSVSGMTGAGDVVASVVAGAALDSAVQPSGASTSTDNVVTYDPVDPDPAPTVTIDQAVGQLDPALVGPILFTVVFSEPVSGFTDADVSFVGSTAPGALVASVSGGGPSYTVSVSGMTGAGDVVASVVAGAALDSAVQPSGASTSTDNVVTYDPVDPDPAPTVTIDQAPDQPDPASGPIEFVAVFSEMVTGFTSADVLLSGTAGGPLTVTVTGSGPTYSVVVSGMTSDGTVLASIGAAAAVDSASQPSAASTSTDNEVTFTAGGPGPTTTTTTTDPGTTTTTTDPGATTTTTGDGTTTTTTPTTGDSTTTTTTAGDSTTTTMMIGVAPAAEAQSGSLPVTGANLDLWAAAALLLLGTGLVITGRVRRATDASN